mmetsp:Transcript_980/g.3483  ORF Transcript_980/g.3483 Transcript_980/m.3483 type:complete len:1036 (+) Transcript_980:90-3197(+)
MAATNTESRSLVDMPDVLKLVVDSIYQHLLQLSRELPQAESNERREALSAFAFESRQKLLRLLVLVKWCSSRNSHLPEMGELLLQRLQIMEESIVNAADNLFYTHSQLEVARAPLYEVRTATEVLTTGTCELPSVIEQSLPLALPGGHLSTESNGGTGPEHAAVPLDEQGLLCTRIDNLLRSKLLTLRIPASLTKLEVANGILKLGVTAEFEASLKLIPSVTREGSNSIMSVAWHLEDVDVLVSAHSASTSLHFTEAHKRKLIVDLQHRLIEAPQPIELVYSVLHSLCTNLALISIIYPQAYAMRDGYWQGKITVEPLYQGKPIAGMSQSEKGMSDGVRLRYWLGSQRERSRKPETYLSITLDSNQHFKVTHSSKLHCPWQEGEFTTNIKPDSIDVEQLLISVIRLKIYTMLKEEESRLRENQLLCRVPTDIRLQTSLVRGQDGVEGATWIETRVYSDVFLRMTLDLQSGRCILDLPSQAIGPAGTAPTTMQWIRKIERNVEDSNRGALGQIFISLRGHALRNYYEIVGSRIGLLPVDRHSVLHNIEQFHTSGSFQSFFAFPSNSQNLEHPHYLAIWTDNRCEPVFMFLKTKIAEDGGYITVSSGVEVYPKSEALKQARLTNTGQAPLSSYKDLLEDVVMQCNLLAKREAFQDLLTSLRIKYLVSMQLETGGSAILSTGLVFQHTTAWKRLVVDLQIRLTTAQPYNEWELLLPDNYYKDLQKIFDAKGLRNPSFLRYGDDVTITISMEDAAVLLRMDKVPTTVSAFKKVFVEVEGVASCQWFVTSLVDACKLPQYQKVFALDMDKVSISSCQLVYTPSKGYVVRYSFSWIRGQCSLICSLGLKEYTKVLLQHVNTTQVPSLLNAIHCATVPLHILQTSFFKASTVVPPSESHPTALLGVIAAPGDVQLLISTPQHARLIFRSVYPLDFVFTTPSLIMVMLPPPKPSQSRSYGPCPTTRLLQKKADVGFMKIIKENGPKEGEKVPKYPSDIIGGFVWLHKFPSVMKELQVLFAHILNTKPSSASTSSHAPAPAKPS